VRSQVPEIKLDDVFEKEEDIANVVKSKPAQLMEGFGYGILKAIVTNIRDVEVRASMSEVNAKVGGERGETARILPEEREEL